MEHKSYKSARGGWHGVAPMQIKCNTLILQRPAVGSGLQKNLKQVYRSLDRLFFSSFRFA